MKNIIRLRTLISTLTIIICMSVTTTAYSKTIITCVCCKHHIHHRIHHKRHYPCVIKRISPCHYRLCCPSSGVVPGYWVNGWWVSNHTVSRHFATSPCRFYDDTFCDPDAGYDPDLATGDDDQFRHPDMDINE